MVNVRRHGMQGKLDETTTERVRDSETRNKASPYPEDADNQDPIESDLTIVITILSAFSTRSLSSSRESRVRTGLLGPLVLVLPTY